MKTTLNRLLDLMLWLTFCALAGTGFLLAFRLPPGARGGAGLSALGLNRHDWADWHTWISYGFLTLIVIHLTVHWRWFWQVAARKRSWPLVLGGGAGFLFFLLLALQPVSGSGEERNAKSHRVERLSE